MHGLRGVRVVDFSTGIAGAYATKLYADAGADVVKVEPPGGDPLRRWTADGSTRAGDGAEDGALFRFLHHGKRSVIGAAGEPGIDALLAEADLAVDSFAPAALDPAAWCARHPALVWLSITPFGRTGPYADRPSSEFTLQAECGSIGARGLPGAEPFQAGGRTTEWIGGTFAAVAALAAVQRAARMGHGEQIDFSLLEVMNLAASNFMDLFFGLAGRPALGGSAQTIETPSIEPTADGYVGFCTNSAQQFSDFLLLIERPELREDRALFQIAARLARFDEWAATVQAWTRRHRTAEIVEQASLLRIPVAPVNDGESVLADAYLRERGAFVRDPTGRFEMPRPPWALDGERPAITRPAPRLGEHGDAIGTPALWAHDGERAHRARERRESPPDGPVPLPLDGLRILDVTAWWAGPAATHMLAALGAEVLHVESIQRPDGMRSTGGLFRGTHERWWEWSFFFLAANTNKRGITLDLTRPEGVALLLRLARKADALVENFTPRVLDGFGLDWETLQRANPRLAYVRMPAFGLDGPWRDRPGFAQTMEQLSGLAWLTGHHDDQPRIQRGPCDPLAGMHAAFALLVALEERRVSGRGHHVECTMVEGALNAAAEALLAWSADGQRMQREGNRSPRAAPQGLYPTRGHTPETPRWLALSVEDDAQWRALCSVLGSPAWSAEPALATRAGRRAAHDAIDAALRPRFAADDRDTWVERLVAAGVPAAPVADPRDTHRHPQLAARGYYEQVDHREVGRQWVPTVPFRYASVARWLRRPAPRLGEHNHAVLQSWLGLSESELQHLEAHGVIGDTPEGA